MKVSKLIKKLKYWKKEYGDREVTIQDMTNVKQGYLRVLESNDLCATVIGEDEDDDVTITLVSYKVKETI